MMKKTIERTVYPSLIIENLLLGDRKHAKSEEIFLEYNIRAVLNVTVDVPNYFVDDENMQYFRISVDDKETMKIERYFEEAIKFIDSNLEKGCSVLIHCRSGVSRSATIVLVYLMVKLNLNLRDAFHFLKEKRNLISPNRGFFSKLIDYEQQIFGATSVKMVPSPFGYIPNIEKLYKCHNSKRD